MEWYRQVQFIAGVPMPAEAAEDVGTTVNGMWMAAESLPDRAVADAHAKGQRVLFSVPLIALEPDVYNGEAGQFLQGEVCRDILGKQALVSWYYWEREPVFAACIYSPVFRHYLLDRCREGIDRGMDAVNLDEINTSIGLMSQEAGSPGLCRHCLIRFRTDLQNNSAVRSDSDSAEDAILAAADYETLRGLLRENKQLSADTSTSMSGRPSAWCCASSQNCALARHVSTRTSPLPPTSLISEMKL